MDYKNAGVDIEAGYKSVELMKKFVQGTMRPEVMGGIGGFSGAFSAAAFKGMEDPVLLSGTYCFLFLIFRFFYFAASSSIFSNGFLEFSRSFAST